MSSKIPYISSSKKAISKNFDEEKNASKSSLAIPSEAFIDTNPSNGGLGTGDKPKKKGSSKRFIEVHPQSARMNSYKYSLDKMMEYVHTSVYLPDKHTDTHKKILTNDTKYYNRFKMPNPNLSLEKSFAHIFFVAPSCNILADANGTLQSQYDGYGLFQYAHKSSPELLQELSEINGRNNDFMMLLSNYVAGFSLSDEYIGNDTYGKGYTGYKIAYGKNNIESRTANSVDVQFVDDRDLHVYQLHKLWNEYISGVYRGEINPTMNSIVNKILDYTGAIYYFLTAEDNETIIFWAKYYGVFPTTVPSTQFSYSKGTLYSNAGSETISVTYQYSFKKEFDPYIFTEFNYNSSDKVKSSGAVTYEPTYDPNPNYMGTGKTYVGSPFVELVNNKGGDYEYKLRFAKE